MSKLLLSAVVMAGLGIAAAYAADTKNPNDTGGTAKGAAAGALAGHEMGSGHAVAGAATGAAIGHHDKAKAEKEFGKD